MQKVNSTGLVYYFRVESATRDSWLLTSMSAATRDLLCTLQSIYCCHVWTHSGQAQICVCQEQRRLLVGRISTVQIWFSKCCLSQKRKTFLERTFSFLDRLKPLGVTDGQSNCWKGPILVIMAGWKLSGLSNVSSVSDSHGCIEKNRNTAVGLNRLMETEYCDRSQFDEGRGQIGQEFLPLGSLWWLLQMGPSGEDLDK